MANTVQVSYKDPTIFGQGEESPWTPFTELNTLFPSVYYLSSPYTAGGTTKNKGEDLPGVHGTIYYYTPVASQDVALTFVVRSTTSKAAVKALVREFVTWVYSIGEFRLSYNNEQYYRRFIYDTPDQFEVFPGIFGYDVELTINCNCIDSMVYNKVTDKAAQTITQSGSTQLTISTDIDTRTVTYTPLDIMLDITAGTMRDRNSITITQNNYDMRILAFNFTDDLIAPFKLYIASSEPDIYYIKSSIRRSLVPYLDYTEVSSMTQNNQVGIMPHLDFGINRVTGAFNGTGLVGTIEMTHQEKGL